MTIRRANPAVALLLLAAPSPAADGVPGLRVPPGFAAREVAGSDLANDIQCMTVGDDGRIIVSGLGYINVLIDDDGDGRADRASRFADGPRDGAMGLLREGDSLYATGDGGLRRYVDRDGDDRADGPPELVLAVKTGGEHDAHAVRRGPDGWLYLIVGNFAGVDRSYASLPTSPIRAPVAGVLLRIAPDGSGTEIVADGFRNAYDFDFGPEGEAFAYDSDNERCVALPWYEPTRFYHVVPGGHHGWLAPQVAETWRMPPWFEDVVPPAASVARGSPTGVVCYRYEQFPAHYRGGFFFLDWTFGRVYYARPERSGATFTATPEVFAEPTGLEGFAFTDAAVDPTTGDLLLSIGGRGTRGAVYRVSHVGDEPGGDVEEPPALTMPPGVVDRETALERAPKAAASGDGLDALRALQAIERHRDAFEDGAVERAVLGCWGRDDRPVRQASARLIATLDATTLHRLAAMAESPWQSLTYGFGVAPLRPADALERARSTIGSADATGAQRLAAARLAQVALGGLVDPSLVGTVWEGYSLRDPGAAGIDPAAIDRLATTIRGSLPSHQRALDDELTRSLAAIGDDDPASLRAVAAMLAEADDPIDAEHLLIVLGRLRAPLSEADVRLAAETLLALDRRLDEAGRNRDRNWPLRIGELTAGLASRSPGLYAAMLDAPEFGRPAHALFAMLPGFRDRERAADRFLAAAGADTDYGWTAEVVVLVGSEAPSRAKPLLRPLLGRIGLDDAILRVLAREPEEADRAAFVDGLDAGEPATVAACLEAIDRLEPSGAPEEVAALIGALRRAPEGLAGEVLSERAVAELRRATGEGLAADLAAWSDWFVRAYPDRAAELLGTGGADSETWQRRLAAIDWPEGDPARGLAVFAKARCAACHSGNRAVGPDLRGIGGRFSRDDLATAILRPDRDVSPQYRSVLVATVDGSIYQGIIIYEAADGVILQTGATETVRIDAGAIEERRASDASLMPAGLLDELSDAEIADLFAYLNTLK